MIKYKITEKTEGKLFFRLIKYIKLGVEIFQLIKELVCISDTKDFEKFN